MARPDVGDLRRMSVTNITNEAGSPADPALLKLYIKKGSGATTSYTYGVDSEIVKDSVGNYHADILLDVAGVWYYTWAGEEGVIFAEQDTFIVEPNRAL